MDNKLSELKDVADYWRKVKSGELPAPGLNEISITVCTLDAAVSRIAALLAELEAKDKRIAELGVTQMTGPIALVLERTAVLERITEGVDQLAIDGGWTARGMSEYAKSLEKKLATPVRLPGVMFIKVSGSAVPVMHAERVKERVHAAGFTVEGDE